MNRVLFEADEIGRRLALEDERIQHVFNVLGRQLGDRFDAGIVNGKSGKAVLSRVIDGFVELEFELDAEEPPLPPIDLIVGLSRPQTNRKILQEATAVGVRSISFVLTERGEPSYARSKLWTTGEWRRHLVAGAAQAFTTRIPEVSYGTGLEEALSLLDHGCAKIAMDNYEANGHLAELEFDQQSAAVAFGSERGWTGSEREALSRANFKMAHLGARPLRTETAVVAGLAFLNQRLSR